MNCCKDSMSLNTHVIMGSKDGTGTSIEWMSNGCHLAPVWLTGFICSTFLFPKMKSETEA